MTFIVGREIIQCLKDVYYILKPVTEGKFLLCI